MKNERIRFLKKQAELEEEKKIKQYSYKPKLTVRKKKKIVRELEDLFLWQKDKKERLEKLKKEYEQEKQEKIDEEQKEFEKEKQRIMQQKKSNKKRMRKRATSSNTTDR